MIYRIIAYIYTKSKLIKSKKGKELGEGRSLSVVAEKLGINIKTADLHSAEYDTELLEEVYKALERMDEDIENFVWGFVF